MAIPPIFYAFTNVEDNPRNWVLKCINIKPNLSRGYIIKLVVVNLLCSSQIAPGLIKFPKIYICDINSLKPEYRVDLCSIERTSDADEPAIKIDFLARVTAVYTSSRVSRGDDSLGNITTRF